MVKGGITVYKKIIAFALGVTMSLTSYAPIASAAPLTTSEAITKFNKYYDSYKKDELVKVDQYREKYSTIKGSLADQLVERTFWYMHNGYMVYGSGRKAYANTGIVDCSNFVSLVYNDFGYVIPTAVREYGSVGKQITGVSAKKVGSYWSLQGTENLRPGDILTWYKLDSGGNKYISHAAIYMGMLNGQPAVIGTRSSGNPTAIGIVNDFRFWWGSNFYQARRVLPDKAWVPGEVIPGHEGRSPVIPSNPILPAQRPFEIPGIVSIQPVPTQPAPSQQIPTNPQPTQPTHPLPAEPQPSGQFVTPKSGWVSYRSAPKLSSTVLGRLNLGETAPLIWKYNSYWYEIEVSGRLVYITTNTKYTQVITK